MNNDKIKWHGPDTKTLLPGTNLKSTRDMRTDGFTELLHCRLCIENSRFIQPDKTFEKPFHVHSFSLREHRFRLRLKRAKVPKLGRRYALSRGGKPLVIDTTTSF